MISTKIRTTLVLADPAIEAQKSEEELLKNQIHKALEILVDNNIFGTLNIEVDGEPMKFSIEGTIDRLSFCLALGQAEVHPLQKQKSLTDKIHKLENRNNETKAQTKRISNLVQKYLEAIKALTSSLESMLVILTDAIRILNCQEYKNQLASVSLNKVNQYCRGIEPFTEEYKKLFKIIKELSEKIRGLWESA